MIEGLRVRVQSSGASLAISLLVPGVPVSSRTTVRLVGEVNQNSGMIKL